MHREAFEADIIAAHELTHALQDQHFDLAALVPRSLGGSEALSFDARLARRFLVEGDAELSALSYVVYVRQNERQLPTWRKSRLRRELEAVASQSLVQRRERLESTPFQLSSLAEAPHLLMSLINDPYLKGGLFAIAAHDHGGWAAIDALYRDPPTSTEQVLHPNERLFITRDLPTPVMLPSFEGLDVVKTDVLGELTWATYFDLWGQPGHDTVLNWDGDRFAVLIDVADKETIAIATVWDDPLSAIRFTKAYLATLEKRFPGEPVNVEGGRRWVIQDHSRVFIFDGERRHVERLVRDTVFTKTDDWNY